MQQSAASASKAARYSAARDADDKDKSSDQQVVNPGGEETDEAVKISKTIEGTDLENVFDITLKVQTSMNISTFSTEPDMAVVIVMDISNTMTENFGGKTRYEAAMKAAENFLDHFASVSEGVSQIGYVAFNTDAHQIFGLQSCSSGAEATKLKDTMRRQTGNIINADGYGKGTSRFTNMEAGLQMGKDMLANARNKNKFIIFLSDGFPTTYVSSGYSGYDPYDPEGKIFYDKVLGVPCVYGTSYSDEAAIRARKMAASIKANGINIFSIGVDIGGQTIQDYITSSEGSQSEGFSVVDRTGTTYEIGRADSAEDYENWLKNSIGSGYYYNSTNLSGLQDAYNQIFEEMQSIHEEGAKANWVTEDPLPTVGQTTESVEFIGFYRLNGELTNILYGKHEQGGEDSATYSGDRKIRWDLKKSGYDMSYDGSKTLYTYSVTYRVRLKNEVNADSDQFFVENAVYPTNDTTTLSYQVVKSENGQEYFSEPKTLEYPIPSVKGYLGELTFQKQSSDGAALAGATFTLSHDTSQCSQCRGDGTSVDIEPFEAVSDSAGTVSFARIPSGHIYTLAEASPPPGYNPFEGSYTVKVAYDKVSVTPKDSTAEWTGKVTNNPIPRLPETGGPGTLLYAMGGAALMAISLWYGFTLRRRRERGARRNP